MKQTRSLIQWKRRGEKHHILGEKVTVKIASNKPPMAMQNQLPLSGLSVFIFLKSSPWNISFLENEQPTQILAQIHNPNKSVGNPYCITLDLEAYRYPKSKVTAENASNGQ